MLTLTVVETFDAPPQTTNTASTSCMIQFFGKPVLTYRKL